MVYPHLFAIQFLCKSHCFSQAIPELNSAHLIVFPEITGKESAEQENIHPYHQPGQDGMRLTPGEKTIHSQRQEKQQVKMEQIGSVGIGSRQADTDQRSRKASGQQKSFPGKPSPFSRLQSVQNSPYHARHNKGPADGVEHSKAGKGIPDKTISFPKHHLAKRQVCFRREQVFPVHFPCPEVRHFGDRDPGSPDLFHQSRIYCHKKQKGQRHQHDHPGRPGQPGGKFQLPGIKEIGSHGAQGQRNYRPGNGIAVKAKPKEQC